MRDKSRWFIKWALLYSFSLFWVFLLFNKINLQYDLIILIFSALIISISSQIYKMFLYEEKFKLSSFLLHSTLINGFCLWVFILIMWVLNLNITILWLLLGGVIFEIVWQINHRVRRNKTNKVVFSIFLIIMFLVTNYFILDQELSVSSAVGNFNQKNDFGTLEEKFSSISNNNLNSLIDGGIKIQKQQEKECPKLNYPMTQNELWGHVLVNREYEGWQISAWRTPIVLPCYKGNEKGEDSNYWYCGDLDVYWGENVDYGLMKKTFTNSDGTIGKTIRKSFYNIYDENEQFIKTVCGKDPDELGEKTFKNEMNAIDKFFSF